MLFRKMLRDLKANTSQFVSIFLMIFMGIFIFTGLNAVGQGMRQSSRQFYEKTNLADAFLYGENFTNEEIQQLEKKAVIKKVERRLQMNVIPTEDSGKTLQLNFVESNQISGNLLIEGEAFNAAQSGIWLDCSYAKANSIEVGDEISFILQGSKKIEKVKGLIMNPEYVYAIKDENEVVPNHESYGYAFLSSREILSSTDEKLATDEKFATDEKLSTGETLTSAEIVQYTKEPFNQLLIKTDVGKTELEEIISTVFWNKQTVLVMQQDQSSVSMFQNEINQMKATQMIFPIAFLLIAILTTITTMTRITVNQRTQIGTFKALGFTNGKIRLHYMSYGATIGIVGGMLGLVLGSILLPALIFNFQKSFYILPEWKGHIEAKVFLIVIICILCCGLSGLLACHKELHGVTAQILRPKAPKASKHTRFEKSKLWNSMRFDLQWNIRDLLRNKLRSFITIIGIVGCMTLIVCALGLRDTVKEITNISYKELNTYATKVNLAESITSDKLLALQTDKKLQFIQETAIETEVNGKKETSMLSVIGNGDYIKQKDRNKKYVTLPTSGIAVTNKFAELQNLEMGDTLKWRVYGTNNWINSKINEIVCNPIVQGIYVSEEAYIGMHQTMVPTSFVTNEAASLYKQEEFSSVQSREDLLKSMDSLMETMNVMIVVLIFAAVLLGVVVLYNLGVLSFHERIRELTTLKVLGFQYNMLRKLLQMQNIWLTLLGIILGVPGGYLMLSYMLKYMGDSFDMQASISIYSYCISILGTLFLSIVVNWFLSRKLKTIDMVSALKSVE